MPKAASANNKATRVSCPVCSRTVSRKADLPRHMRIHSPFKREMSFKCPYEGCEYMNLQKSNVETHVRTHTQTRDRCCPDCDYATIDPGLLTRHRKRYHGYRPTNRKRHDRGGSISSISDPSPSPISPSGTPSSTMSNLPSVIPPSFEVYPFNQSISDFNIYPISEQPSSQSLSDSEMSSSGSRDSSVELGDSIDFHATLSTQQHATSLDITANFATLPSHYFPILPSQYFPTSLDAHTLLSAEELSKKATAGTEILEQTERESLWACRSFYEPEPTFLKTSPLHLSASVSSPITDGSSQSTLWERFARSASPKQLEPAWLVAQLGFRLPTNDGLGSGFEIHPVDFNDDMEPFTMTDQLHSIFAPGSVTTAKDINPIDFVFTGPVIDAPVKNDVLPFLQEFYEDKVSNSMELQFSATCSDLTTIDCDSSDLVTCLTYFQPGATSSVFPVAEDLNADLSSRLNGLLPDIDSSVTNLQLFLDLFNDPSSQSQ